MGSIKWTVSAAAVLATAIAAAAIAQSSVNPDRLKAGLKQALLLHASFDGRVDADFAAGDPKLYTAVSKTESKAGLHREDVSIVPGGGRHGDALRFAVRKAPVIFYKAQKNMGFKPRDWSGTISLWLNLDPDQDLEPGYCDPIQVTDKHPLDEGIFVEFTKDHAPRRFRMAVCPSKAEWNPSDRKWEEIPNHERPIVELQNPPFARGKWTHVAVAWDQFNTGRKDGVARLYLDGKQAGVVRNWVQNYRWDESKAQIKLGLSYIGLYDEVAIFNRALTADEVAALHALEGGVKSLAN